MSKVCTILKQNASEVLVTNKISPWCRLYENFQFKHGGYEINQRKEEHNCEKEKKQKQIFN